MKPIEIHIREIAPQDAAVWEKLRRALWPEGAEDHAAEIQSFFAGTLEEPVSVLMAESAGTIVAFAEISIRSNVAGLDGKRAGYVEGLYVIPEVRHRAIAKKLLEASRSWERRQKCTAFVSDRAGCIVIDSNF